MLPAVIDLFAGAGGLSLGALRAHADVRLHVDNDQDACSTIRANRRWWRDTQVIQEDIRELTGRKLRRRLGPLGSQPLLVIGGAPCQPFSKAAYWTDPGAEAAYRRARASGVTTSRPAPPSGVDLDGRRELVGEFWRLVLETNADGFVFENVISFLHPRNKEIAERLIASADDKGYHPVLVRVNAAEYGVPQRRERIFILGVRNRTVVPPKPTHFLPGRPVPGRRPALTASQAIAHYADACHHEPEEVVSGRWAEHLSQVPPGWNYKAHTSWAGHPKPTFVTETRFWSFLLKLDPNLPSWTISANPGPWVGPFHWESRRLRTPELAALQSFPRSYRFVGNRRSRVRQIGNAVPPLVAQRMIEGVVSAMSGSRRRA